MITKSTDQKLAIGKGGPKHRSLSRREMFKLAGVALAGGIISGREHFRSPINRKQCTGYGSGSYGGA